MKNIVWDKKYSIGHERIDHEHQVFLDLIHNVANAREVNAPREKVLRLLTEVKMYAEFHFFSEESIMLDIEYPEYDEHRDMHNLLLSNLDIQINEYRENNTDLYNLIEFLLDWFVLHTTIADKRIAAHILANDWINKS